MRSLQIQLRSFLVLRQVKRVQLHQVVRVLRPLLLRARERPAEGCRGQAVVGEPR